MPPQGAPRIEAEIPNSSPDGRVLAPRAAPWMRAVPVRRGPALMVLACLVFTAMVTLVKVARAELDTVELMAWRSCTAVPLAWLLARKRGGLGVRNRRVLTLRVALGIASMYCFYEAARGLWLTDLILATRLEPVLVAIAAPWVLGVSERPGRLVWGVTIAGFAGCAILLAPQLEFGSLWGLWALGAAVLSSGVHLALRRLSHTDSPAAIVFWFQASAGLVAVSLLPIVSGGRFPLPPAHLLPHLVGIGLCATLGQLLMTRAYALDRAPVVAAASHSSPLFAVCADMAVFGVLPGLNAVVGGALLVAAGLVLVLGARPVDSEPGSEKTQPHAAVEIGQERG